MRRIQVPTYNDKALAVQDVLELAEIKVGNLKETQRENVERAEFACVSLRVLVKLDLTRDSSRAFQSKLVESHMHVAFVVPEHRQYMYSGTPSEPVLTEAAGRLMQESDATSAPKVLCRAFDQGFLAPGERGELVARLLMIMAYDRAAKAEGKVR